MIFEKTPSKKQFCQLQLKKIAARCNSSLRTECVTKKICKFNGDSFKLCASVHTIIVAFISETKVINQKVR